MKMAVFLPISGFLTLGILTGMLWIRPKTTLETADGGDKPDSHPRELGSVGWLRGYGNAARQARAQGKDLLILFQEVPGCATCVGYGQEVLSHPLIVEAVEHEFVPLAVYNNIGGEDKATLEKFGEPSWNNPVVRIVTADGTERAPRLNGDYSQTGIVASMVTALRNAGKPVPEYLRLLKSELDMQSHHLETATFAMYCFWTGEAELGRLEGVASTRAGYLNGKEVVEVVYDPSVLPYDKLVREAGHRECATTVFSRNAKQQAIAAGIVDDAVLTTEAIRPDREPKYYRSKTLLRFVPMTELQSARVNSAIASGNDPGMYLSPGQRRMLEYIKSHPSKEWKNLIGIDDLRRPWDEVVALMSKR